MSKKVALLTRTVLWTRVIADVPDDWDETNGDEVTDTVLNDNDMMDTLDGKITDQLVDKLRIEGITENIDGVWNDLDCPYDEIDGKYTEPTMEEKLAKLESEKVVSFDESTYDQDEDRPMMRDGYILGICFEGNGRFRFGVDNDGYLFTYSDSDLDKSEKEYIVNEAYAYRFGE